MEKYLRLLGQGDRIGLTLTDQPLVRIDGGNSGICNSGGHLVVLITTPEVWVMLLGDLHYGFPYLSGAGRLVLKNTLMLAGAMMIIADSARAIVKQRY